MFSKPKMQIGLYIVVIRVLQFLTYWTFVV